MSAHAAKPEDSWKPIAVGFPTAMRLTDLGRSTLYEKVKSGELQTVKVGTRNLILYASLERLFTPKTTAAEAAL